MIINENIQQHFHVIHPLVIDWPNYQSMPNSKDQVTSIPIFDSHWLFRSCFVLLSVPWKTSGSVWLQGSSEKKLKIASSVKLDWKWTILWEFHLWFEWSNNVHCTAILKLVNLCRTNKSFAMGCTNPSKKLVLSKLLQIILSIYSCPLVFHKGIVHVITWLNFYYLLSREWTENGQLWVQQVSSTPATRLDVVNLQV